MSEWNLASKKGEFKMKTTEERIIKSMIDSVGLCGSIHAFADSEESASKLKASKLRLLDRIKGLEKSDADRLIEMTGILKVIK